MPTPQTLSPKPDTAVGLCATICAHAAQEEQKPKLGVDDTLVFSS